MALLELKAAAVQAVSFLKTEQLEMGVVTNDAKAVALPASTRAYPNSRRSLSAGRGGSGNCGRRGSVAMGFPIGMDVFVKEHALQVVQTKGAEGLACLCSRMPNAQAANAHCHKSNDA